MWATGTASCPKIMLYMALSGYVSGLFWCDKPGTVYLLRYIVAMMMMMHRGGHSHGWLRAAATRRCLHSIWCNMPITSSYSFRGREQLPFSTGAGAGNDSKSPHQPRKGRRQVPKGPRGGGNKPSTDTMMEKEEGAQTSHNQDMRSVDEQLRALAKQATEDSELPLFTQKGLEDFFEGTSFGDFIHAGTNDHPAPALKDIMEESRPRDLYHHVRFRESERKEEWNLGPLKHGILPLEMARQIEQEGRDTMYQQIKERVDKSILTSAEQLSKILQKQNVDTSAVRALKDADQMKVWSPLVALKDLTQKEFDNKALSFFDDALSSSSLGPRKICSEEEDIQLQIVLLKLTQLVNTNIEQVVSEKLQEQNEAAVQDSAKGGKTLEPDEEFMQGLYSSFDEYKKDYLNLSRHLDPLSHKILPESLEQAAPADLADTARTLEENPSLTSKERAEMMQLYADNVQHHGKRQGRIDRHGQYYPKHWRESGEQTADTPAVDLPDELMNHQNDPWHIRWDVDRSIHNEDAYGPADNSLFEDDVDPASLERKKSKQRSATYSKLPPSFMGVSTNVLRQKFDTDQELLEFINWARQEEVTSSRAKKKRRRGSNGMNL